MEIHMNDDERRRHGLLHSKGFMSPWHAADGFRQAGFFIKTMEEFIESSTAAEVAKLKEEASKLEPDDTDEFWAWNYPDHWEDIFGARIRSAFCTQLCSQVESTLGTICSLVQILERFPLSIKDLKGSAVLEQHRKYLTKVGRFANPSPQLWDEMGYIFRLRNIFIHEDGYIGAEKDRSLVQFLSTMPNIKIQSNVVELQAGSCPALLEVAKRFSDAVFAEYDVLLQRLRLAEQD